MQDPVSVLPAEPPVRVLASARLAELHESAPASASQAEPHGPGPAPVSQGESQQDLASVPLAGPLELGLVSVPRAGPLEPGLVSVPRVQPEPRGGHEILAASHPPGHDGAVHRNLDHNDDQWRVPANMDRLD